MDKRLKREIIYNTVPKLRDGILEIEFDGRKYVISPWLKRRIIIKNILLLIESLVLVFTYRYLLESKFDIPVFSTSSSEWKMGLLYILVFMGALIIGSIVTSRIILPRNFSQQVKTIEEYLEDMR